MGVAFRDAGQVMPGLTIASSCLLDGFVESLVGIGRISRHDGVVKFVPVEFAFVRGPIRVDILPGKRPEVAQVRSQHVLCDGISNTLIPVVQ